MRITVERRDPGMVIVLSFFTCGLYLIYWYARMYDELEGLTGQTPTGMAFFLDFILNLVTCGIYGIWVDYRISVQMNELQAERAVAGATDSTMVTIGLDVAAYVTGFFTNFVTSAIHQDQLNKIMRVGQGSPAPQVASGAGY